MSVRQEFVTCVVLAVLFFASAVLSAVKVRTVDISGAVGATAVSALVLRELFHSRVLDRNGFGTVSDRSNKCDETTIIW